MGGNEGAIQMRYGVRTGLQKTALTGLRQVWTAVDAARFCVGCA